MLIKNGNIHVGDGTVLNDYDVLIEDGIIKQIGKDIRKENMKIINAQNKEVFPGFIDPISSLGCMDITSRMRDQDEISAPITPEAKIKYSFNHSEIMLQELYKVGITTVGASPGNINVIGGQMAAYKTWGLNSNRMLIKDLVGLKGSVIDRVKEQYGKRNMLPMTKMGIFAALEDFLNKNTLSNSNDNTINQEINKIIDDVLNGNLPLFITANKATEINSLINIIEKSNIKLVIVGAYQADRCLEEIQKINASVIVGEQINYTKSKYNNTDLLKISELSKEGNLVSFTLTNDYGPNGKVNYLWNAIEFYKSGVPSEDVVKMMTINPAKILKIDDKLGTIEEGKVADLVIYSKNPIEFYDSKVINTIIEGNVVYSGGEVNC